MARSTYLGTGYDYLFDVSSGGSMHVPTAGVSLKVWDSQTGGTQYTDLLLNDGSAASSLTVATADMLNPPAIQGPPGVNDGMWFEATPLPTASNPNPTPSSRVFLTPSRPLTEAKALMPKTAADVGALPNTTTAADIGADTAGAASAVQQSLNSYKNSNDTAVGKRVKVWESGETVAAGDARMMPSGDVMTAKTAHTTGSTPTYSNWQLGSQQTATFVGRGSARIDLNAAPYNAKVGQDITTTLQNALNYVATNCPNGGEIYFSEPGQYLINGAPQTGTAQGYSYNGQILIPAVTEVNSKPIVIRGTFRSSGGGQSTGAPNGVILKSNATSGYVFDIMPSFTQFGCPWTGVMPIFEDLVIRTSDNPTAGGINLLCTQRAKVERVQIDTPNSWVTPNAGTLAALLMPQIYCNGDTTCRDVTIRGYPIGIVLGEHGVFDNVDIAYCMTAFQGRGAAHPNWLGYVDVEECPTVFDGGSAPAFGTPANPAGSTVYGFMDFENGTATGGSLAAKAFVNDTPSNPIRGQISLFNTQTGSQPIVGGRNLDVVQLKPSSTNGPWPLGSGWHAVHPYDDFKRLVDITGTGAPGQCSPTLHPWRVESGSFSVVGGKLQGLTGNDKCFVPCIKAATWGGISRTITWTVTLGATTPLVRLYASAAVNSSGTSADGGTTAIEVKLQGGQQAMLRAYNNNIRYGGPTLAAGSTHTIKLTVLHDATGYPAAMKMYVDGTLYVSEALTGTLKTLGGTGAVYPYYEDGIFLADTGSQVTLFSAQDATPDPPFVTSGTATLAAGTVTVSNSYITANSVIRYWRTTAGGTTGQLSYALTAGTGFTINSSSNTDTSQVYYEIVRY